MTLNTCVYVLDEISYRDVFAKCNQLIGAHEGVRFTNKQMKTWKGGVPRVEPGNPWNIGNDPGQGLCALLDIYYQPNGPLRVRDGECDAWVCLPGCTDEHAHRACWLEVHFDTSYGYLDSQGRRCGDLHASLVAQLGAWLDERNVRWLWQNEFTGEIHEGYDRLVDLCTPGFETAAWFRETVAPLLRRR